PPDSTGKITGGFIIEDPEGTIDDTTGKTKQITLPATVIVDALGREIGYDILQELKKIHKLLEEASNE
ncbi:MAG TPA: hypothetical protein VEP90_28130, partial [Methylomirabilota bacterium]|nr:hypothetical protein [Methylomirabilota bacterium]